MRGGVARLAALTPWWWGNTAVPAVAALGAVVVVVVAAAAVLLPLAVVELAVGREGEIAQEVSRVACDIHQIVR